MVFLKKTVKRFRRITARFHLYRYYSVVVVYDKLQFGFLIIVFIKIQIAVNVTNLIQWHLMIFDRSFIVYDDDCGFLMFHS